MSLDVDNYYVTQIPINSDSLNYNFNTTIGNNTYIFRLYYNRRSSKWILDIKDELGNNIIMGIPLLNGAQLVSRFVNEKLLPLKFLTIYNKKTSYNDPTEFDLGTNVLLLLLEEI